MVFTKKQIEKRDLILRRKYQPQWHFKTKISALNELTFQRRNNPDTYRWLKTKDIRINGKRTPVKKVIAKKRKEGNYFFPLN